MALATPCNVREWLYRRIESRRPDMKLRLVHFSAVIVGNVHNPSILSPAFLELENIVPSDGTWEVAENLTTPAFAIVRYMNGISITVEPNRIHVMDLGAGEDPIKSTATSIAAAYASALPHVHYSAVGMNYQSIVEHDSSGAYLKQRFLKPGPWDNSRGPLGSVGLRLVYDLDAEEGRVTLSLDAGEIQLADTEEKQPALLARANFHRGCTEHPADRQIAAYLSRLPDDWSTYRKLLTDALACEEQSK